MELMNVRLCPKDNSLAPHRAEDLCMCTCQALKLGYHELEQFASRSDEDVQHSPE